MRAAALAAAVALGLLVGPVAAAGGARSPPPYVQPGCTVMFLPGEACVTQVGGGPGAAKGCCVPGFRCSAADANAGATGTCQPVPTSELTYNFAAARGAVAGAANAYDAGKALEAAVATRTTTTTTTTTTSGLTTTKATTTTTTTTTSGCVAPATTTKAPSSWCSERRLLPGDACDPSASPTVECCPDGYSCSGGDGNNSGGRFQCRLAVTASPLAAATEPLSPSAAQAPALRAAIAATAAQCAGGGGGGAVKNARAETDTTDAATAAAALATATPPAAAATAAAQLPYPPPPLPADACSCRVDGSGRRVPASCPSAWSLAAAGGSSTTLPPALRINTQTGVLELTPPNSSVAPPLARLRGINWFGWETGQKNFDGLWAYCDDMGGGSSCPAGAQIPPWSEQFPGGPALSSADRDRLRAYFWGKRTSTNDFAAVVHALKVLGFNSVRVPFTFSELAAPLPDTGDGRAKGEMSLCLRDDLDQLTFSRLADPSLDQAALRSAASNGAAPGFPRYSGAPHPPPAQFWPTDATTRAKCDLPWEAPMIGGHADPSTGDKTTLRLTTCNWYLPQAPGTAAIHRFLFQIEYLVSQGFYVVLSYHPTAPRDAVTADAALFASNWGNLWRSIAALPSYSSKLRGRVFPDLLNEGSRYGCLYERAAMVASGDGAGTPACAPAVQAMTAAAAALRAADPSLPGVLFNGLGQSGTPADVAPGGNADCVAAQTCFPGMPWGDGYITKKALFSSLNAPKASNASALFASSTSTNPLATILALSPHAYPSSITGWPLATQEKTSLYARFNASWGLKIAGRDVLYSSKRLPRRPPALLGEVGMYDDGNNGVNAPNADTTKWRPEDLAWLADVRRYFDQAFLRVPAIKTSTRVRVGRAASNYPISWFFWSWNANSADTKGLVGPTTTWRAVQWTKVRALVSELGLQPWYCSFSTTACPAVSATAAA